MPDRAVAGSDPELPEDLSEGVVDSARAYEEARRDLRIRRAPAGQRGDPGFVRSEVEQNLYRPSAGSLTRCLQINPSPLGEPLAPLPLKLS